MHDALFRGCAFGFGMFPVLLLPGAVVVASTRFGRIVILLD